MRLAASTSRSLVSPFASTVIHLPDIEMAGSQQYKDVEILYVLKAIHMGMPPPWVRMRFEQRFKRKLSENQLRYLKNKYGRDPRFG